MADQGIKIDMDEDVKSYLVKNGYDPEYGARPVQRLIRREILAGLSKYLLQNPKQYHMQLTMDQDTVKFSSLPNLKQKAA
jgi:ATP-dependent Clp protease ATP-binding subunit ClpA